MQKLVMELEILHALLWAALRYPVVSHPLLCSLVPTLARISLIVFKEQVAEERVSWARVIRYSSRQPCCTPCATITRPCIPLLPVVICRCCLPMEAVNKLLFAMQVVFEPIRQQLAQLAAPLAAQMQYWTLWWVGYQPSLQIRCVL